MMQVILLLFIIFPNVPVHGGIVELTKPRNRPTTPMPPSKITPETTTSRSRTCADFHNPVDCNQRLGCGFNVCKNNCVELESSAQKCSQESYLTECRRGNSWYAVCGLLCQSHKGKDKGNCKPKGITIAVNLNGRALAGGGSRNIPHEADAAHLYNDFHPTPTRGEIDNVIAWCRKGVTGICEKDRELYSTLIYGRDAGRGSGRCLSYRSYITNDGRYELNLRLLDPAYCLADLKHRHYNVRLNGELILPELGIGLYVGHCQGMDLFTEFDVRNGYLTPAGFGSSKVSSDGLVLVEFCYGDGEPGRDYDASFVAASFYIIELTSNDKILPTLPTTATPKLASTTAVMESTTDKETMTTPDPDMDTTTHSGTELTTITPDPTMILEECPFYTNLIECKMAGCEFNKTSGCSVIKECTSDTSLTTCRRGDAYYTVGGVTCISKSGYGDCELEDVVIAVNIFVPEHVDSKQITHLADTKSFWSDERNSRQDVEVGTWSNSQCMEGVTGIPDEDRALYSSLIVGRNEARDPDRCIMYHTNISTDGRYAFSVRTVETFWSDNIGNGAKPRQFNIRLNGMTVWPEFNILHRASACQGIELLVEFDVTGLKLTPAGLPSTYIKANGGFEIEFCYGDGYPSSLYDPNYIIASFYIVKLKSNGMPLPPPPPTFPPTRPTTRRTTTRRTTTTPQSILSTTLRPVPPGPTPTFPPGSVSCKNARAKSICDCLDPHNHCDSIYQPGGSYGEYHCVGRQIFCRSLSEENQLRVFPDESCKRARATYSYGGFICNNEYKTYNDVNFTEYDVGACEIEKTIIAVRFNGNNTHRDARGVDFVPMSQKPPKNPMDYEFNYKTLGKRIDGNTLCHEDTAPKKLHQNMDRELWIHYVTGKNKSAGPLCFNYTIPIEEDGSYELSIKTIEYESGEKDERAFNIFLNEIPIFREIEPNKIWKAICVPIDLISVFEVSVGVTTLSPRGFPDYPIEKGGIEVAFCNGQCTTFAKRDYAFKGVAFSVVKLIPQ